MPVLPELMGLHRRWMALRVPMVVMARPVGRAAMVVPGAMVVRVVTAPPMVGRVLVVWAVRAAMAAMVAPVVRGVLAVMATTRPPIRVRRRAAMVVMVRSVVAVAMVVLGVRLVRAVLVVAAAMVWLLMVLMAQVVTKALAVLVAMVVLVVTGLPVRSAPMGWPRVRTVPLVVPVVKVVMRLLVVPAAWVLTGGLLMVSMASRVMAVTVARVVMVLLVLRGWIRRRLGWLVVLVAMVVPVVRVVLGARVV